ncbi:MAG: ribonuclease [Pseudomonadota bacterium]|jgi:ribonuclease Y
METSTLLTTATVSVISAVVGAVLARKFVIRTQSAVAGLGESAEQVVRNAKQRRDAILEEALKAAREELAAEAERLEEDRAVVRGFQDEFERELNQRQSKIDRKWNDLQTQESQLTTRLQKSHERPPELDQIQEQKTQLETSLVESLIVKTNARRDELSATIHDEVLNAEKLGISKWMLENQERLKNEAQRGARDVLLNIYNRYSPRFIWPKTSFNVEAPSKDVVARHFAEGSPLVALLLEGTDTALDAVIDPQSSEPPTLKISSGAGVDKEIIRLTLEEMFGRNQYNPDRVKQILQKHRQNLDRTTLRMGQEAIKILGLDSMHPEILKLIGALNYRTSHRQNQYFHSLEVARLAGMLADEVGVDPKLAKRAGILHDIGKVLDYKIEGSHAVISGDYATRFGEAENVVDTVLSHHDDKIVETPHAYILKAADAMSGARPGARVDMEEGFQKRIEGIAEVINSFQGQGVTGSAIMHAGREVHVFVDNRRIKEKDIDPLAQNICRKLESDVQFPGQIKVTVVRRIEISEVA